MCARALKCTRERRQTGLTSRRTHVRSAPRFAQAQLLWPEMRQWSSGGGFFLFIFFSRYFGAPCTLDLPTATPPASIYIPQRLPIAQSDSPAGKQAAVCGDIGLKSNHSSAQSQYCFSPRFSFFSLSLSLALFCMHVREGEMENIG